MYQLDGTWYTDEGLRIDPESPLAQFNVGQYGITNPYGPQYPAGAQYNDGNWLQNFMGNTATVAPNGGGGNPTGSGGGGNLGGFLGGLGDVLGLGGSGGSLGSGFMSQTPPDLGGNGGPGSDPFNVWNILLNASNDLPGFGGSSNGTGGSTGTSSRSGTSGSGTNTNPNGTPKSLLDLIISKLGASTGGLGGLANLYGAIQAQKQQDWNNNAKISTLNYLMPISSKAQGTMDSSSASYLPQMEQEINTLMGMATPAQQAQLQGLQQALQSAPGAFNSTTPLSRVPGTQDIVNWLGGLQGQGANALGGLQSTLANGPLVPGQSAALGLGSQNNPYSQQLGALSNKLTGGNPYIDQAQGVAAGILGKNPLLPMSQVISMAQNQSATQAHNAMNALRRQELNRTGVTGPAIASGSQDELLGSLQDQAMQNMSSATTNAMMGQQGLQSQLFGQGANLFGTGQNAYLNQMLGGAGLINSNVQNQLGGLNSLGNLAGAQTGQYNALSNLFNGMSGSALGEGGMLQGVQNFGLASNNDLYSQIATLLGQQGAAGNNLMNGSFQAANFPQNIYNQNTGLLQNINSNTTGLFGNPGSVSNQFANIFPMYKGN